MASTSKQVTISSIDDLIALIASCDTPDLVYRELNPAIARAEKNGVGKGKNFQEMLQEPTADGKDPLDVLQPAQYGLGYLWILAWRLSAKGLDPTIIMQRVTAFARDCRPVELAYRPELTCFLVGKCLEAAEQLRALQHALEPIGALYHKLTSSLGRHHLTPIHRQFAYLCIRLDQADRFVQYTNNALIHDIHPQCPITYQDNLLYHYYAGTLFALAGHFEKAVEMLETVVSAPGSATAAVQLEAYKKLVLVNYLHSGKALRLPKYTSQAVQNLFKSSHGEAYLAIVDALHSGDLVKTDTVFQKHIEVFRTDNNVGLVEECIDHQRPQVVRKLTETYVALSLSEIATHLLIPEPDSPAAQAQTEQLIQNMISSGQIHAEISRDNGEATVAFLSDPEPYNSVGTAKNVDFDMQMARYMGSLTRERGDRLGASKDFLQKALTQAMQSGGPGGYASVTVMDEDVMGFAGAMRDEGTGFAFDDL